MRATWSGKTIAQSDDTVVVDGNHYFPRESLVAEHFTDSETHSVCPWKGTASYLTVEVGGQRNVDAAWYYPAAKDAAKQIEGRVAFWRGVQVTE